MARNGPYADSRTIEKQDDGSHIVTIPKEIVDRYNLEDGDKVFWTDDPGSDRPRFIPPEEL